ncbi:MAG: response regulator [Saprospiraceae bacterium]|nr:response regulator [Saprospiraceae bacterium]
MKVVLVIEEDEQMRENIMEILELSGYHVESALDGLEGLQKIFTVLPDLVICNVVLPGILGYEVLESVRMSPKSSEIPFILLTPDGDGEEIIKSISAGADNYLSIPFEYSHLVDAVERHLQSQHVPMRKVS